MQSHQNFINSAQIHLTSVLQVTKSLTVREKGIKTITWCKFIEVSWGIHGVKVITIPKRRAKIYARPSITTGRRTRTFVKVFLDPASQCLSKIIKLLFDNREYAYTCMHIHTVVPPYPQVYIPRPTVELKTVDSIKPYIYCISSYVFTTLVKFNLQIRHSKRLTVMNNN